MQNGVWARSRVPGLLLLRLFINLFDREVALGYFQRDVTPGWVDAPALDRRLPAPGTIGYGRFQVSNKGGGVRRGNLNPVRRERYRCDLHHALLTSSYLLTGRS